MFNFVYLIPLFPMAGFLVLALFGQKFPRRIVPWIGAGSVGLSAILSAYYSAHFLSSVSSQSSIRVFIANWINVGMLKPDIAFYLDALSVVMMCVVTGVGFLIHVYAAEYMANDKGYSRFFAYLNLFVSSMLILILADNFMLLLVGWEGVGLCSYLLIGFWYNNPANGRAARKAFIVTRIGDLAMMVGIYFLFSSFGTVEIQPLMKMALSRWQIGSSAAILASALLFGGAVGKSAQLPLQVWLPDAMAGPTPVSALIHAATMVTAGVYLVARAHVLFQLAPPVLMAVAIIGTLTLLIAGASALVAVDFKRVLAYSTISQIGYMFVGLGVGAWAASFFHFVTHAFFKALLFLAAGAVIECCHHENNILKMGGLRKQIPLLFWVFLAGSAALAALPYIASGFYSKDLILKQAWSVSSWLVAGGLLGSAITAIYAFRLVFLVFMGPHSIEVSHKPGQTMTIPMVILAIGAIFAGILAAPVLGKGFSLITFLQTSLPVTPLSELSHGSEILQETLLIGLPVLGLFIAWLLYVRLRGQWMQTLLARPLRTVSDFLFWGWGFDWLYQNLLIRPYVTLAAINKSDFVDWAYNGIAQLNIWIHQGLSWTQAGTIRKYALGIVIGGIILIAIMVLI